MSALRGDVNALRNDLNSDRAGVHRFRCDEIRLSHRMNALSRVLNTRERVGDSIDDDLNAVERIQNALPVRVCSLHARICLQTEEVISSYPLFSCHNCCTSRKANC